MDTIDALIRAQRLRVARECDGVTPTDVRITITITVRGTATAIDLTSATPKDIARAIVKLDALDTHLVAQMPTHADDAQALYDSTMAASAAIDQVWDVREVLWQELKRRADDDAVARVLLSLT